MQVMQSEVYVDTLTKHSNTNLRNNLAYTEIGQNTNRTVC